MGGRFMKVIISYIILYVANSASVCSSWAGLFQPKVPKSLCNQMNNSKK